MKHKDNGWALHHIPDIYMINPGSSRVLQRSQRSYGALIEKVTCCHHPMHPEATTLHFQARWS
ncbi:hypothetical protein B0O80DRAFT_441069 [Mortierella sp. GBAus27b]|nr:hypothetical protein B0O80DRAFT_441069 [Mortierella sp. GBAus27b]